MSGKKKPTLSMQQELDIIRDIEALQPISTIAEKYHVNLMTILRMQRRMANIHEFSNKNTLEKKRPRLRKRSHEELENRLFTWFTEKKTAGDSITDNILLKKAVELKESIASSSEFKATKAWLTKFKTRHQIRLVHTEQSVVDVDAAKRFVDAFNKLIEKENINVDNIYNMGESSLLWKAVPTKILAELKDDYISDYKIDNERFAMGLCVNASGTNKIAPLVIYKFRNPKALKHCKDKLPVILKSQEDVCMDKSLLIDWYENYFKPIVRDYQQNMQISGKVILLLEDCEEHRIPLKYQDDNHFKIIYLPPNTASLIQPVHQGIIEKTKILFRHKMLQSILKHEGGIRGFYEDYSLNDCINLLHNSWNEITSENVRNAWSEIIKLRNSEEIEERDPLERDLQDMISSITGNISTEEHITEFLSACEEAESNYFIQKEEVQEEDDENKEYTDDNMDEEGDEDKENNDDNKVEEGDEDKENSDDNKDEEGDEDKENDDNKDEEGDEDKESNDDNMDVNDFEEQKEIIEPRYQDNDKEELKYIFERLMFYGEKAPRYIQLMIEGLRQFFLDNTNEIPKYTLTVRKDLYPKS